METHSSLCKPFLQIKREVSEHTPYFDLEIKERLSIG